VVEVQRADRPYASFYLSFTSSERDIPRPHRLADPQHNPSLDAVGCAAD
jgi:hypothetical protein